MCKGSFEAKNYPFSLSAFESFSPFYSHGLKLNIIRTPRFHLQLCTRCNKITCFMIPKTFQIFGFPTFWLWVYLMKVFPARLITCILGRSRSVVFSWLNGHTLYSCQGRLFYPHSKLSIDAQSEQSMIWYNKSYYLVFRVQVQAHVTLVRKDMNVNEHERLSNITLKYKLK